MITFDYKIKDELGIHARPAGLLVKEVGKFASSVKLNCEGKEADGKKLMAIMMMAVKADQIVTFTIDGEDEKEAAAAIEEFMKNNL